MIRRKKPKQKRKLLFRHPNFSAGVYRIEDLKLDEDGKPLTYKGERVTVRWKFSVRDNGKWWEFNSPEYVLLRFPHCVWESEEQYEHFMREKKRLADKFNKDKANEKENQLSVAGMTRELELFRQERKRRNV